MREELDAKVFNLFLSVLMAMAAGDPPRGAVEHQQHP